MTSRQICNQYNHRLVSLQDIESYIDSLPTPSTSPRARHATKKQPRWKTLILISITFCAIVITLTVLTSPLQILVVKSGSMQPTIHTADVIITLVTPIHTLQSNDIITYQSPDNPKNLVTHRIVNIIQQNQQRLFQTKGDANDDLDHYIVPSDMIIGRMVLVLPYFGFIIQLLHSVLGFFLLILIPGTIIIATEAYNILKTIKIQNQI